MNFTKPQIIGYIIVAVAGAAIGSYALYANWHRPVATTPGGVITTGSDLASSQNSEGPAECEIDAARCEKVKTYRSEKLGVEFQIHESAKITEEGNRIYVTPTKDQYVEIIPKYNLQSPLEKVVELNGPTSDKCKVTRTYWGDIKDEIQIYPATFTEIVVFAGEGDFDRVADGKKPLCQSKYAGLNYQTLFLADDDFPTKIAFFMLGQYWEPAGFQKDWQHTFRFIK